MDSVQPLPLPFLARGVAQVAFVVEDLDTVVEKHWRTFGTGPWHFYTYGPPLVKRMSFRGKPAEHAMRVALSYFGPTRVEFIQPLRGQTVFTEFVRRHGYGIQHLGFLVDDMTAALAQAAAAGLEMVQDGSGFGPDGDGHYAYLDTERDFGFLVELIQRPKRRAAPEKIFPGDTEANAAPRA
jgi:catechol 2,3-dioxygenase-like lactoylglutathione lyase family enzyme